MAGGAVRHDELAGLLGGLDIIRSGRAATIELTGDPGAGKTRLLTELAAHASARHIPVLRGSAVATRQHVPFYALHHALRGHVADDVLDGLLGVDTPPEQLSGAHPAHSDCTVYTQIRALLRGLVGDGLVLLLDDFQQADTASVGLVDHLLRWPVDAPLLLVVAHRPRQASPPLRGAFAELAENSTVTRVELRGLTEPQSADLLGMAPCDPRLRRLHAEAEGNPLYLLALAAAAPPAGGAGPMADPAGTSREVIDVDGPFAIRLLAELAPLTPEESEVAAAAAILGARFDLDALATVAGLDPQRTSAAVDGLRRRDILRLPGATELTFRHPMVAGLIRATSDLSWLSGAHRRALTALSLRGVPAAELAEHIDQAAGVHPDDHSVMIQAAQDALPRDPSAAARWLRAALRRTPDNDRRHDTRVQLLIALTQILLLTKQDAGGHHMVREIRAAAQHASPEIKTNAIAFCASLEATLGRYVEARAMLDAGVAQTPREQPDQLAALRCTRAIVAFLSGTVPSTADVDAALRHAREHRQRAAEATGLALRALCLLFGGSATAAADVLAESAELVDALPDMAIVAGHPECLAVLGWTDAILLRLSDAERHLRRGLGIVRGQGYYHLQPVFLTGLAYTYQQLGRLTDAARTITEAHEALCNGDDAQRALLLCLDWRNMLLTDQMGRDSSAMPGELADAAEPSGDSLWGQVAALCLADAAMLSGDPELSGSLILAAGGGSELLDLPSTLQAPAFAALTLAALTVGADADKWMQRTASSATLPQHRAFVLLARGHMAHSNGEAQTAFTLYRDAAKGFCEARMTCDQARALMRAASCALRAGELDDAAAMLLLGKQLARQGGASRLYRGADVQLREVTGMRATVRSDPGGNGAALDTLTDREREVADAASTGKRTREIARQLGLSPRTVDVHLTRIYRKLGIRSRAALARMVAETR